MVSSNSLISPSMVAVLVDIWLEILKHRSAASKYITVTTYDGLSMPIRKVCAITGRLH